MDNTSERTRRRDLYWCPTCKIDSSTKSRMVPCPRRSCDAVIAGEIRKTITIVKFDNYGKK